MQVFWQKKSYDLHFYILFRILQSLAPFHIYAYAHSVPFIILYTRLDVRLPMIFCNHRTLVVFCTFVKHDSKVEEQSSIINKHLSSHIIL